MVVVGFSLGESPATLIGRIARPDTSHLAEPQLFSLLCVVWGLGLPVTAPEHLGLLGLPDPNLTS